LVNPESLVRRAKPTGRRKDMRVTLCTITVEFSPYIEMQDALDPMDPIFALIRKSAK
jgi:hypothetical protein